MSASAKELLGSTWMSFGLTSKKASSSLQELMIKGLTYYPFDYYRTSSIPSIQKIALVFLQLSDLTQCPLRKGNLDDGKQAQPI